MIRVNLLPVRKARRRSRGLVQLLLFFGVIVFQVILLTATYFYFAVDRDDLRSDVAEYEAEVEKLKEDTDELERLQTQAEELQRQYEVLSSLEAKRVGPVPMLDELQEMLTPAVGPVEEDIVERREWGDPSWDPQRVWLESFNEEEGGRFTMDGYAADTDDFAQFLQRLTNATYFRNVDYDHIEHLGDDELVGFHVYGDYDYGGFEGGDDDEQDS